MCACEGGSRGRRKKRVSGLHENRFRTHIHTHSNPFSLIKHTHTFTQIHAQAHSITPLETWCEPSLGKEQAV